VKRFDRLGELAVVLAEMLNRPVTIVVAGDGELRNELAAKFSRLEGLGRVSLIGFRRPATRLISEADGLIVTSDHEGMPVVALEAAVVGTPVFGFAVGGLVEVVGHCVPGVLVPPGDVSALARAVAKSLRDGAPPTAAAALSEISIVRCAQEYAELYRRVLCRE